MPNKQQSVEHVVDLSPRWIKRLYVIQVKAIKKIAYVTGVLGYLDRRVNTSKRCHYLRSLLAVHQLQDMVALDIPWWTYDAIAWVERYLQAHPNASVFEYGSGASTVWLAKRAKTVVSLEHDKHWFDALKPKLEPFQHVTLMLESPKPTAQKSPYVSPKAKGLDFESYVHAIHRSPTSFDIIVIDGRARIACLQQAIKKLNPKGVLLLDNSNRTRYQQVLKHKGFKIKRFAGLPGSPFKSETAVIQIK